MVLGERNKPTATYETRLQRGIYYATKDKQTMTNRLAHRPAVIHILQVSLASLLIGLKNKYSGSPPNLKLWRRSEYTPEA